MNGPVKYNGKEVNIFLDLEKCPRRDEISIIKYYRGWGRSKVRSDNNFNHIEVNKLEFYENDLIKGCDKRCRQYYLDQRTNLDGIYIFSFSTPESRKEFLDYYEIDYNKYFKKTSDLPAAIYDSSTRTKPITAYNWTEVGQWKETKIDDINDKNKIFYFVKLNRWNIEDKTKGNIALNDFESVIRSLRELTGKDLDNIVGIRNTLYKKIEDKHGKILPNWRPISELIETEYNDYINNNKLDDILGYLVNNSKFYGLLGTYHQKLLQEINCPQFQSILKIIEIVNIWNTNKVDIIRITKFIKGENAEDLKNDPKYCVNDMFDELCNNLYPMLKHVKNYYYYGYYKSNDIDETPNIIEYVNTIYEFNKQKQSEKQSSKELQEIC